MEITSFLVEQQQQFLILKNNTLKQQNTDEICMK
jgi:hypothetical protein